MASFDRQLRAAEAALGGPERWKALRLDLTSPSGESVLTAGGCWDDTVKRFCNPSERDAETGARVALQESQIEFATWFAEWLCEFREGIRGTPTREVQVAMLAGDRRGGKTFVADAAVIAACVDVPIAPGQGTPLIAWIVSKSFRERWELEQWILNRIPGEWYRHLQAPEHEFRFIHGPTLRLLSADDPDSLKQGRVDVCFINEPQKLQERAVANVILGASDLGGLVILAANPPTGASGRGEWLFDLKEALDDERIAIARGAKVEPLGVKYFHVDSKKNKAIDQIARRRAGRIVSVIAPSMTAGDVEGEWRRPVDLAAWEFDKRRHLKPIPQIGCPRDVTVEAARRQTRGTWPVVGGIDFQNRPHIPAAFARVFGDPDDPIFHFFAEFVGERRETEEQFLERFDDFAPKHGFTKQNLLWIGDASGAVQDSKHDFSDRERTSFSVFSDAGWEIIPSQPPKPGNKTGRGKNPDVGDRLQLVNELLRRDRVFVDEQACPWLAECFRKTETKREDGKRKLVSNRYTHMFDAATYLIWRLSPVPKRKTTPAGPEPRASSFRGLRPGGYSDY
jgi:hypothetical protein